MERKKEDRRVRITKQAIRESLVELMGRQPISKISVKMICEAADINRSTFYAHYKDQYALLHAVQGEVIGEVKAQIFSARFFGASGGAMDVLVRILEYGCENAALVKVLLSENGDASFQSELMQLAHEKFLAELEGERSLPPRTLQYLNEFAVGGLLSIMRRWLETDCADEPEMIADLMMKLLVSGTQGLYSAK
ncbi:TetR/AcrR family transcriptional regulator [Ruminococcaceae bacterium OttesenSCG-928-D13]|nr:TetR/AcrR family transcriptional regulator [Ruminococcaceae bacterium OttesenSCG-928-D13]